jgi:hypothetical protein
MSDKLVQKYFENMPYGEDAKSSEIHGPKNQDVINTFITSLVRNYDQAMADNDKETAGKFYRAVTRIKNQLDNLKDIKSEFAVNYGGGTGGKNLFSNYTDLSWDRKFWTEQGEIRFDESLNPILIVKFENGEVVNKKIEDITENWVVKGDGENQFMKMQQDAVRQRNNMNKPLDFDVDFAISNLLADQDNWKSFVADKIGGRYFLHDYMVKNEEAIINGDIPQEKLTPDSFDPELDNRLHNYFATRIRKSFNPGFLTPAETKELEEKPMDLLPEGGEELPPMPAQNDIKEDMKQVKTMMSSMRNAKNK